MTPKTLDKYIAALKKKAAAEGWTKDQYEAELDKFQDEMIQKYLDGDITLQEAQKAGNQIANAKKNPGLLGKPAPAKPVAQTAQTGMTHEEYIGLWEALKKKQKTGLITQDEYHQLGVKLDQAKKEKKTVQDIAKVIGCDPGTLATDESVLKLGKELKKIYGEAGTEIRAQLDEFLKKHGAELKDLETKFINGTIDQDELNHLKLMNLQKNILGQKADQIAGVMLHANKKALGMIQGEQLHVFAENANYQSWSISQDAKVSLMFSVYDEHTVKKLITAKPELLPRKIVDGKKDKAWNKKIIAGAVTQAVIQGDSIPKLARRIATQTGETNMKAMMRYARTAMTSAQNSGRQEMLHEAAGMGIKAKKVWLATLDARTRDVHAKLDGQKADIDKPFHSDFGDIMFPGDMGSSGSVPGNLYNCRCTLVYDYEDFPNDAADTLRRDNETGQLITDMPYDEWKAAKEGSKLNELNAAKISLSEAQKALVKAVVKEDKVYEGIWKDPVILADYPAKKDAIQGKRDYYDQEIQKYKDAQAAGSSWATDEKIKDLEKKRKLLNEFEKRGQLLEKRDSALKAVQDIYDQVGYGKAAAAPAVAKKAKKASKTAQKAAPASGGTNTGAAGQKAAGLSLSSAGAMKTPFGPEAYTKERKDKALWSTDKKHVDSIMRPHTGEVWRNASAAERDAIYEYTQSFSKYNEPLRGIEYGSNVFKGVGNTDLNTSRRNGNRLNYMTDIIDKCSYDHDQWLQRGVRFSGMDKFFNVSERTLRYGTEKELQNALLGTTPTEYGFMSMGSAKGQGFSGDILLNIYAPKGTKMMYAEPFSAYSGSGAHLSWDGKSTQHVFGHEFETIMQQGTQFRVTKVERKGGQIFVDMEVINQDNQQRWKKK